MLYLCIPAYNEGPTVGLVLWNIHKVFSEFSREYEIIVVDDASDDSTTETLATYGRLLPLTVIRHEERQGYAASLDALGGAGGALRELDALWRQVYGLSDALWERAVVARTEVAGLRI